MFTVATINNLWISHNEQYSLFLFRLETNLYNLNGIGTPMYYVHFFFTELSINVLLE